MNAIEFVKKYGINEAKRYSKMIGLSIVEGVSVKDLKQIVDAFGLVERFGDLRQAKLNLEHMISHNQFDFCATNIDELQKAISLVEQCQ